MIPIRPGAYFTTSPVLLHNNQGNCQLNDFDHFPIVFIYNKQGVNHEKA